MAKKARRFIILLFLMVILVSLSGCWRSSESVEISKLADYKTITTTPLPPSPSLSREALDCLAFIDQQLTSPAGGIYTNYQITTQTDDLSTGHEILSESMGLLLEYARLTGDEKRFSQTADYIQNFLMTDDILMWRILENGDALTDVSATIDDLRIYQTLALASQERPLDDASQKIFELLEKQLPTKAFQANYLVNYYSSSNPTADKTLEVAYIDLAALKTLTAAKPETAPALETNKQVLLESFISETLPLYHKSYDPQKKTYGDPDGKINILDSLMAMQQLAEIGIYSPLSLDWLEEKTVSGTLYSYYDVQTGEALDNQSSSAAYGITAQIGAALGNEFLTANAISQLKKHQNQNHSSPFYGGFGYHDNAYSYDNLQALLGLIYSQ